MTNPAIITGTAVGQKAVIGPRAALLSTLRLWFLYRDEALWAFVSGAEPDNLLDNITIGEDVMKHITDANEISQRAWALAQQIGGEKGQKPSTVIREAVTELLATEQPRFLLSVPHVPGTF